MPTVQKRAFPLAGLMYALRGIAYAHEGIGIWLLTLFIAPALCGVGTWIVSRIQHHARDFFHSSWARRGYVAYVLVSAELLVIYSITQIIRTLIK